MSYFNAEILAELQEDMEDDFGELVDSFIEDAVDLMKQIESSYAALDAKGMQDAAHALKSSSGYMGAEAVTQLSNTIESCGREDRASDATQAVADLRPALDATLDALRVYSSD